MKKIICIIVLLLITSYVIYDKNCDNGIDLSHHNKLTESKVCNIIDKKDIKFAYLKASEGKNFKDDKFGYFYNIFNKKGVLVGAYCFYRDDINPVDQFNNFQNVVKNYNMDLIPVVDFEDKGFDNKYSKQERLNNLKKLVNLFHHYYGKLPVIYCSPISYYITYPEIKDFSNLFWLSGNIRLFNTHILQKRMVYNNIDIDFNCVYNIDKYKL